MPRCHPSAILCLSLCLGAVGALAQPLPAQGTVQDGERQHRRVELRTALLAKPAPAASHASAQDVPRRQLSPIERAEMRQQLRAQQAQAKQHRP